MTKMTKMTDKATLSWSTISPQEREKFRLLLSQAYHEDADFRSRCDADPRAALAERGFDAPSWIDVRIVANTPETYHVVLPPDPNAALSDEDLNAVAGGKGISNACQMCNSTGATAG